MPFQKTVNTTPAPAVDGDFASVNPMASVVAPESGFVAGAGGVTVGRFAWISADGKTLLNTGTGKPDGFVPRLQTAQIGTYLAESGNVIPEGFPVDLMRTGNFYSKATIAGATKGDMAFAKLADGTMQPAAAGATVVNYIETDFVIDRTVLVNELTVMTK